MSSFTKLMNNLQELKLEQIKANINSYIDIVNNGDKTLTDALSELTSLEINGKKEKRANMSIKTAGFPFLKTLDEFDFDFQPTINKELVKDLATTRFVENKENILLLGNPGVGKTHLSVAIGIETAKKRYSTYFITAHQLLINLKQAKMENRLDCRLKHYAKYSVLIIDEIGYLPISTEDANIFFQLINLRYEKNSTIITTNKEFSKWTDIFADVTTCSAILDRLLHHAKIIKITGKSFRTKDIVKPHKTA